MLVVDELTARYGAVVALHGVSVSVAEGELVALVGPNGAGKTTLLNHVAGLLRPAGGRVLLDGVDVTGAEPARLVRAGLALVPERRRIFRDLTVGENLQLAGVTASASERRSRLDEARQRFPVLADRWSTAAGFLSGGEAQQLAVARALMSKPRIILLDEPTLGLAPIMVNVVFDLLVELRAGGTTVFVVEQNARRALEIADRGYVLRTGRVAVEGRGADLAAHEDLFGHFVGAHERARPEPRRRRRAGQHVRPAGARHLADLRRDAPRQLRPRRADHGRRLRRLRPLRPGVSDGGCWRRRSCWRPSSPRWSTELAVFRRVRGASPFTMLLASFALEQLSHACWAVFVSPNKKSFAGPAWVFDTVEVAGIRLEVIDLVTIGTTAVVLAMTAWVFHRTLFGISVRAASEDFDAARLMGVRANRVISGAFAYAGLLAGVAAVLVLMRSPSAEPTLGSDYLVKAVVAAIVGGLGSFTGAVVGGVAFGVAEVLLRGYLPEGTWERLTDAVVFVLIAGLFVVRPQGLFTVHTAERV